jgi:hypothetical protein
MGLGRGWSRGNRELMFNGCKVTVMQDEYVLETHHTLCLLLTMLCCTFKNLRLNLMLHVFTIIKKKMLNEQNISLRIIMTEETLSSGKSSTWRKFMEFPDVILGV